MADWTKLAGFYIFLAICHVCVGFPIDLSSVGTGQLRWMWVASSPVVGVLMVVVLIVVLVGCVCCRPGKGFQEFRNSNGALAASTEFVNPRAGAELTIFPPAGAYVSPELPTVPPPLATPLPVAAPLRPASFSSADRPVSSQDWFYEPHLNFPRAQLQYVQDYGRGWFGRVVAGEAANIRPEEPRTKVMVKILHEDATPTDQMFFLHEVKPHRDLKHPNILSLWGWCLDTEPFLLLLESCPNGDLKSFLTQNLASAHALAEQGVLLRMARDVTSGISYMHAHKFVHTDLAARNCLLAADLTVKIGDYGNAVEMFPMDYYMAGAVALPVRWCAPETLRCTDVTIETKEVTTFANVWTLGVVLWEICALGRLPYESLSNDQVIVRVLGDKTQVLPQPTNYCLYKQELYHLMKLCWNPPLQRPTAAQIQVILDNLVSSERPVDGGPTTALDFEQRWQISKPNSIPKTDNAETAPLTLGRGAKVGVAQMPAPLGAFMEDSKPLGSESPRFRLGKAECKPQEQGELEQSEPEELDSWLRGVEVNSAEDETLVRNISEAIRDLDLALAAEKTSSSEETSGKSSSHNSPGKHRKSSAAPVVDFIVGGDTSSFMMSPKSFELSSLQDTMEPQSLTFASLIFPDVRPDPALIPSLSDTEEEIWKTRLERGEFSEKVKEKSKSIADLMILTHIDPSDDSDEGSQDAHKNSLLWRTSQPSNFGSDSDIRHAVLEEGFHESLKRLSNEHKEHGHFDSLNMIVPDETRRVHLLKTLQSSVVEPDNFLGDVASEKCLERSEKNSSSLEKENSIPVISVEAYEEPAVEETPDEPMIFKYPPRPLRFVLKEDPTEVKALLDQRKVDQKTESIFIEEEKDQNPTEEEHKAGNPLFKEQETQNLSKEEQSVEQNAQNLLEEKHKAKSPSSEEQKTQNLSKEQELEPKAQNCESSVELGPFEDHTLCPYQGIRTSFGNVDLIDSWNQHLDFALRNQLNEANFDAVTFHSLEPTSYTETATVESVKNIPRENDSDVELTNCKETVNEFSAAFIEKNSPIIKSSAEINCTETFTKIPIGSDSTDITKCTANSDVTAMSPSVGSLKESIPNIPKEEKYSNEPVGDSFVGITVSFTDESVMNNFDVEEKVSDEPTANSNSTESSSYTEPITNNSTENNSCVESITNSRMERNLEELSADPIINSVTNLGDCVWSEEENDGKLRTPDDERSSDSGFRDKGSLSESVEDACEGKYNLEDIEAELEEAFVKGVFDVHDTTEKKNPMHFDYEESKFYEEGNKTDDLSDVEGEMELWQPNEADYYPEISSLSPPAAQGWYLHPPEDKTAPSGTETIDDDFVKALRSELANTLPLQCRSFEQEEQQLQDVTINIEYNGSTPLTPIFEETDEPLVRSPNGTRNRRKNVVGLMESVKNIDTETFMQYLDFMVENEGKEDDSTVEDNGLVAEEEKTTPLIIVSKCSEDGGRFEDDITSALGSEQPSSVVMEDLEEDGAMDVICVDTSTHEATLLPQKVAFDAEGEFTPDSISEVSLSEGSSRGEASTDINSSPDLLSDFFITPDKTPFQSPRTVPKITTVEEISQNNEATEIVGALMELQGSSPRLLETTDGKEGTLPPIAVSSATDQFLKQERLHTGELLLESSKKLEKFEMSTSFMGDDADGGEGGEGAGSGGSYTPDWETGSSDGSMSSGEFIWKEGGQEAQLKVRQASFDLEPSVNEGDDDCDDGDDGSEDSSDSASVTDFVPSAWNSQAAPVKPALRTSSRSQVLDKRRVWFKKEKYHCIYEYPREPSDTEDADMIDYSQFADWELQDGDVQDGDESLTDSESKPAPAKCDFYTLGALSDDGEFFVSSSTRPFQSKPLSGFYTGSQFSTFGTSSLWAASPTTDNLLDYVTPDSGVEDMTTPPANSSQASTESANKIQGSTDSANSSQTPGEVLSTSVYKEEGFLPANKSVVFPGILLTSSSVYKEEGILSTNSVQPAPEAVANDSQVFNDSRFLLADSSVHRDEGVLSANNIQGAPETEFLSANKNKVCQEDGVVPANSSVELGLLGAARRPARESLTLDLPINHNSQLGLVLEGIKKGTGVELS